MKQVVLLLFLFTHVLAGLAQTCKPDSLYRDSLAGVYPRPITAANPNGGITKKACINEPFDFTLTVVIPDTVSFPGIPFPVNLNYAKVDTTGAILGLPQGIKYSCNPPDCKFNARTIGCIILHGVPTSANAPGQYKPTIKLTLNNSLFGSLTIDYPGPQFPGEYILTLDEPGKCATKVNNAAIESYNWYPNPSYGILYSNDPSIQQIRLYDAMGKLIYSKNNQTNELNLSNCSGLFLVKWSMNNQDYFQKIYINP